MLLTSFLPHRCTAFTMTMTTVIYIYYIDYVDRVHKRTKHNARKASLIWPDIILGFFVKGQILK